MKAQQIIDECDIHKTSPREFRSEMNLSGIINDVKKKFREMEA